MNSPRLAAPDSPTLEVSGLVVDIPLAGGLLHAVRSVDLRVERGQTLCIVGESGCGKSMTSLALMGLLPAGARQAANSIRLLGEEISGVDDNRLQRLRGDRMAMVFQEPMTALNPAYTIGNQLIEGLIRHRPGTSHAQATQRAVELLQTCGIGEAARRLRQYPHQLSGGLRQRVMIAMALMTAPNLLIADEPTTALDATIQAQILDLLKRLQQELSLAIILITHNFDVVRRIGDRVAVMYAGEIVESGPTQDVLANPQHPYTRALLSCIPAEATPRAGRRLGFLPGTVPSLVGSLKGCQFGNRCSHASADCKLTVPLQQANTHHAYRCRIAPADLPTMSAQTHYRAAEPEAGAVVVDTGPMIELRQVQVHYDVSQGLFARKVSLQALRDVTLCLSPGETLGIVGESGSGKSTLARVMLGLEAPGSGQALLMGRPVRGYGRAARARLVQPIFQDPYSSLNPRRTLESSIRLPLDIHAIGTSAERDAMVRRMMDLCGLPARLARALPAQLSGGQRQRVAIASALIMKPRIVICDEPTSALDVSVQAQILNLLMDLKAELQLSYVVISHDLGVIRSLADRVVVMYLGAVVEDRRTTALFEAPAHPYSAMLLAATRRGTQGTQVIGEFPNPLNPPAGCAFHPRCASAQAACRDLAPELRPHGDGRVACPLPLSQAQHDHV